MREDVDYINALFASDCPLLRCEYDELKGRMIRVTSDIPAGFLIYQGKALHAVCEDVNHWVFKKLKDLSIKKKLYYDPIWYWCALCSFTGLDELSENLLLPVISDSAQKQLLMLYRPDPSPSPSPGVLAIGAELSLRKCQVVKLEVLLQTWKYNCFEHSDKPLGFSVHFLPSFLAHSCHPNAIWDEDGTEISTSTDTPLFSMRSRRQVKSGDELTISYLPEEHLCRPVVERRKDLHATKGFFCECERCGPRGEESSFEDCSPNFSPASSADDPYADKARNVLEDLSSRGVKIPCDKSAVVLIDCRRVLGDGHWISVWINSYLIDFYTSEKKNHSALQAARLRAIWLERLLPESANAALAWAWEEHGDLEFSFGDIKEGLSLYARAESALGTLFGERSRWVSELKRKISRPQ